MNKVIIGTISLFTYLTLLIPSISFGQESVEMADTFRSEGKIYVVILVVGIVLMMSFI